MKSNSLVLGAVVALGAPAAVGTMPAHAATALPESERVLRADIRSAPPALDPVAPTLQQTLAEWRP